jgi:hypothetical protein
LRTVGSERFAAVDPSRGHALQEPFISLPIFPLCVSLNVIAPQALPSFNFFCKFLKISPFGMITRQRAMAKL